VSRHSNLIGILFDSNTNGVEPLVAVALQGADVLVCYYGTDIVTDRAYVNFRYLRGNKNVCALQISRYQKLFAVRVDVEEDA